MEKSFRSPGGLPLSPRADGSVDRGGEAVGSGASARAGMTATAAAPLASRIRAACWGCLVGILIGLALSELWPS